MTTRKKYPKEFKLDAVSLVLEQEYTKAEASRSLGINPNLIARWIQEHQADESGQAFRGNGKLNAANVYYVNADDNYRGAVEKLEILEAHGIQVLIPNQNDFDNSKMNALVDNLTKANQFEAEMKMPRLELQKAS